MELPAYYEVKENKGPDFVVYYLEPEDSTLNGLGRAGVYFGRHPGMFGPDSLSCTTDTAKGTILKISTTWNIYSCGHESSAESIITFTENNKIHAFIKSKERKQTDSMIILFETLRLR